MAASTLFAGGLSLNGTTQYVTAGSASGLGSVQFTVECWFKRTGAGQATNTGAGGLTIVPLVAKGRNEGDGGTIDFNYILGIRQSDGVLAADFEDRSFGLNHPIAGVTPIPFDVWTHAAATYDGLRWRLYLNGVQENTEVENAAPRYDTVQHFGMGSALNSSGVPDGFFTGIMDEVRVWELARSQAQIQAAMNTALASGPGLLGRWGFDEGSGSTASDSSGNNFTGTIVGGANWTTGAPLAGNEPPAVPQLISPDDNGTAPTSGAPLAVAVNDLDSSTLNVTFFGRPLPIGGGEPFTIIALPDTQFYSESAPQTFIAQTEWIVANREAMNIRYVASLGDIVNQSGSIQQWINAKAAFSVLDEAPELAYGLTVGNHDQEPCCGGSPDGSGTENFNAFFPYSLYQGVVPWYGGHHGTNNDNSYYVFSASGMNFVVVHIEWNTTSNTSVLDWAEDVFRSHPNHRGILICHYLIQTGFPGTWGTQGLTTYNALRDVPNLFLAMCGHISGEGRRIDTFAGNTLHTLLSDYQSRTNFGDGWLRILEFRPADNEISVKTYSVTLDRFETDADSEFTIPYSMGGSTFSPLATRTVPAGGTANALWPNLIDGRHYEWYATVSDGEHITSSPRWTFQASSTIPGDVDGDGDVDLNDLTGLLTAFGSCTADSSFNANADFDGNGCVELNDLTTLLTNFGQ